MNEDIIKQIERLISLSRKEQKDYSRGLSPENKRLFNDGFDEGVNWLSGRILNIIKNGGKSLC